ncbi:MAG TPA: hypothetical protein VJ464_05525 [Blastocatellia bacterium]|nr:hypothetical protein [Blastocatellia bacterium]
MVAGELRRLDAKALARKGGAAVPEQQMAVEVVDVDVDDAGELVAGAVQRDGGVLFLAGDLLKVLVEIL